MYILDTDHLGILQSPSPERQRLVARIGRHSITDFFVTIITFQEQVSGWLAYINRATDAAGLVRGYSMLGRLLTESGQLGVLPFDLDAANRFMDLKRSRIRVGTMDLRIAAIALERRLTVLTRNTVDFSRVPGLVIEDWTI